ncbi:MAG: gamma-glutamyl-gamma-aminobutyrate hydrolase family protein [Bacteroidales bacterium]|nr:gamma-glutamyl-gamma-aminobutyrate hydrolase family protein [Bacteroidales bacterium]
MKHLTKHLLLLLLVSALLSQACWSLSGKQELRIAISKEGKSGSYSGWLKRHGNNIQWFNLYPLGIDSALQLLKTCDGLLLTGGEDVFPGVYGKIGDTPRCGAIDRFRDSLEFALIQAALVEKMPVFGICRGLQILNVKLGGTLYIDIPADFDTTVIHRQKDWQNCFHSVQVEPGTMLYTLSKTPTAEVTSNHHQGIELPGEGLRISAFSFDKLPEAIEWENGKNKSFLMGVQWHPERMDTLDPLSAPLAGIFLKEAEDFRKSW